MSGKNLLLPLILAAGLPRKEVGQARTAEPGLLVFAVDRLASGVYLAAFDYTSPSGQRARRLAKIYLLK